MVVRSPRILSICTGAGGLDLGVRLACPNTRTVCYVEREGFAVAVLVAAMENRLLDEAPVWSDLRTFDGAAWRGAVDWLIGGIPCQPHSYAGTRAGSDDDRDLWPDTARIIREIRPQLVFLENVAGITGYYHEQIGPELQAMGYTTEEGLFSAAEVGAPHRRQRLFVLGYTGGGQLNLGQGGVEREILCPRGWDESKHRIESPGSPLEEIRSNGRRGRGDGNKAQGGSRRESETAGPSSEVADADGIRRGQGRQRIWDGQPGLGKGGKELANAGGLGCEQALDDRELPPDQPVAGPSGQIPDSGGQGLQGLGWAGEAGSEQGLEYLFPPGPSDLTAWSYLLDEMPPAEPSFCRDADGVAEWLELVGDRSQRLRLIGNGVVPLVAAYAFRTLSARLNTRPGG